MPQMPFSPCDSSQPTCSDATVGILQHIFGPVIDSLVRGTDPNTVSASANVFAALMSVFNTGVLSIAAIIISYVAAMGAIQTANDGEAMGKGWDTVMTPLRLVSGGTVLLTSSSGYSFIQMFVLTLALWGVGFANGLYKMGMGMGILKADGLVSSSYQPGTYYGMRDFGKQYLKAAYCARVANALYADGESKPKVMVDMAKPDRKVTKGTRIDYTYFVKDRNESTNLGGGEPICGTISLVTYTAATSYADTSGTQAALDSLRAGLMSQKLKGAVALMQDIDQWVATMPSDANKTGWDAIKSRKFNEIVKAREDKVVSQIANAMSGSGTATSNAVKQGSAVLLDSLTREGWAMAAGWHQRVGMLRSQLSTITTESVGSVTSPSLSGIPADSRAKLLVNSVTTVVEAIVKKAENPENGYESPVNPRPEDLASSLPTSSQSDMNVGSLSGDFSYKVSGYINSVMLDATKIVVGGDKDVDAVSRMKLTGDLLATYRAMFLTAKFTINTGFTATRVIIAGVGSIQILGTKVDASGSATPIWDWLQTEITPVLADIAKYLGILAFYFSVILPSMPYTIFMITVVGWVLGVIQTVIAVQLWAIMHMRPSQTFIGSDSQGYILMMAMFVRPALAVCGLFAADLVADPIVDYITKAFFAMRGDVVASTGWIGVISQFFTFFWWFAAYGLLLLPVLYMIYALPQVLPDHVLKYLNVGIQDLGATGASSSMQSRLQPMAAEVGASTAKRLGGNPSPDRKNGKDDSANNDSGGGNKRGNEPINAGKQGVMPATDSEAASSGEGGAGSGQGDTSSGAEVMGGTQGVGGSPGNAAGGGGKGAGGTKAKPRSLSMKVSDAIGVAAGRAVTDTAMAVKDAMAGGGSGIGGRLASNLKEAAVTAGSEGVAAFKGGAKDRINEFKGQMAVREALAGGPSDSPEEQSSGYSAPASPGGSAGGAPAGGSGAGNAPMAGNAGPAPASPGGSAGGAPAGGSGAGNAPMAGNAGPAPASPGGSAGGAPAGGSGAGNAPMAGNAGPAPASPGGSAGGAPAGGSGAGNAPMAGNAGPTPASPGGSAGGAPAGGSGAGNAPMAGNAGPAPASPGGSAGGAPAGGSGAGNAPMAGNAGPTPAGRRPPSGGKAPAD